MTDYNAIQLALEKAMAALQADIAYLQEVKADQNIIDAFLADVASIDRASELVWQYKELES